jgi:RNA recognition motif-containing protein
MAEITDSSQKKRKLHDGPELEIDVSAPEPPSKKALRKAKKRAADRPDASDKPKTGKDEAGETSEPQAAPAKDQRSEYGIWIGNLAFSTTKDDLRNFFTSNCSFSDTTITRIHLPKGQEKYGKAQNKGFAYVDFSTQKALQEALGLSEQLLTGRAVLIKNAKSFEGRPAKTQDRGDAPNSDSKSGHPPSKRIFVGNLAFDVTKEALEEHFAQCGTVANVHMATFQDTGKCKGYGWVVFDELPAAEAAVRGFALVTEEDGEEEQESDSSDSDAAKQKKRKSKKPRQRRVWVNQLMGRRMRAEFAEDATTRYKKRFGKDGEGKKKDAVTEEGADASEDRPRIKKAKKPFEESRYSEETVQRLSGAIVEAQGKKISFD